MTSQTRWPLQHHQPKSPARVATMAATEGNGFSVRAQPARVRVAPGEYLGCPNCSSTDLKKVSLAYQEGLFYTVARTRLRAVVVGGCGPDLIIGKATTRGFHQSVLSKQLYSSSEVVVSQADSLVGGWCFSRSAGSSFT